MRRCLSPGNCKLEPQLVEDKTTKKSLEKKKSGKATKLQVGTLDIWRG